MVKRRGFTIVELMIVIVIIAILARIVFVAYNNVQARSRDTIRKNDIASLAKQIQIYALQNRTWTGNCGDSADTLNGYTNYDYSVAGNSTITACLKTFDDTNKQLNDPSGCVSMTDAGAACNTSIRSAYKAYNTIAINGHYYLLTKLETVTGQTALTGNAELTAAPMVTPYTDMISSGFNYVLKVR